MATLQSPGVSVTVIDESIYADAGSGTVPLIVTATRQNKLNESGELASGTLPEAGDSLTLVTSRRDLIKRFGKPQFKVNNGTVIHGDETNEYGLHAAWRVLNQTNRAYILNANIDLAQLEPSTTEPTRPVEGGTHWLDLSRISFGLFEWNSTTSAWEEVEVQILTDAPGTGVVQPITANRASPKDTFGVNGDYAAVVSYSPILIYKKEGGTWKELGAEDSAFDFQFAPHTRVPTTQGDGTTALANGDMYIKTTVPRGGAFYDVSSYSSEAGQFITKEVPLYMANDDASKYYKGIGELTEGALYMQIDNEGPLNASYSYDPRFPKSSNGVAAHTLKRYNGKAFTEATSNIDVPALDLSVQSVYEVVINGVTVTFDAAADTTGDNTVNVEEMAIVLQANDELKAANIRTELHGQRLKLIHTQGLDITVKNVGEPNTDWTPNTTSDVAAVMGFNYNVAAGQQMFRKSNWEPLEFIASFTEPRQEPELNTLWFNPELKAEFLESYYDAVEGAVKWRTYAFSEDDGSNGLSHRLYIRSNAPESANNGDLWIDSDDQENYPAVYRYSSASGEWNKLDNTDQETTNGIVFGNYSSEAPFTNGIARDESSVLAEYAPDPSLYPEGILFMNMDYSTNNVKEYQGNGVWASVSGNRPNGSPYMGRHAQRQMVVKAMKRAVLNSREARARDKFFNLIAAPGYPELLAELNALNVAKKQTAFVVGSAPMRLRAFGNDVQAWATNQNGAFVDGEDGLVTLNNMSAIWAFSGLQSDANGNLVSVPADVMALDVLIQNDRVAYPWFAPAGDTRGLVPATTAIGYVEGNEFRLAQFDDGLVDTLYTNNINPIINFPNEGIKVWGQKTLTNVSSSMDRINVARLVAYLRYMLERITRPFLFEQNDAQTRQAAANVVEKFLADIVQKRGITDFVVQCDASNNTPARIDRNELWIDVAIVPTKSVEFIYIPVRLKNTGEI